MRSLQIEQLNKRVRELKSFSDYVRQSIAFFKSHPSTEQPKSGNVESLMLDPSPECQTEYNLAVAADGVYASKVAATNAAMADEQAADLLRQAAWETYWNCESP